MVLEKAHEIGASSACDGVDTPEEPNPCFSHTFVEMWEHLPELGVVQAEAGDELFGWQACRHQR